MNHKITIGKQNLSKAIADLIHIVSQRKILIAECKEIGEVQAITSEIERLTSQFNLLSDKVDITETDICRYQKSVENHRAKTKELSAIQSEIQVIKNISSVVEEKFLHNFEIHFLKDFVEAGISFTKQRADEMWLVQRAKIISDSEKKLSSVRQEIENENKTITSLQSQIDGNAQIKLLSEKIVEERGRLHRLKEKLSELENLNIRYREILIFLSSCFEEFSKIYSEYVNSIDNNLDIQLEDLKFSAKKVFRCDKFIAKVTEIINNRTFSKFEPFDL